MTGSADETWLRGAIAGAIRAATADVAGEGRVARFATHLGRALHDAARRTFPYEPNPVRTHSRADSAFPWDIFVGQYGSDETGTASALLRGLWAVGCALDREPQQAFDELVVAHVDQRLVILPTGTRLASGLQSQCRVAKVSCWVAEVDPLDKWSTESGYTPWVKLQFIAAGR